MSTPRSAHEQKRRQEEALGLRKGKDEKRPVLLKMYDESVGKHSKVGRALAGDAEDALEEAAVSSSRDPNRFRGAEVDLARDGSTQPMEAR